MTSIREISQMLSSRAVDVARYLLPNGKQEQREWVAGSIHGEAGRSLKVCIDGAKQGVWSDFADGESGDLISLWCAVRGVTVAEALKEIKGYLGIVETTFAREDKKKIFNKPQKPKGAKAITQDSPVMKYLKEKRRLTEETIKAFNIGECDGVGPWTGWKSDKPWKGPWMVLPFRKGDEVLSIKYLHIQLDRHGKKQTLVEPGCKPSLFGWKTIKSSDRTVAICEGEIDAMSLCQYGQPALSVPFGGGKGDKQQWVQYEWQNLEQFEMIYICMDNDEEGEVATMDLIERLGRHRCKIVTLPHKDANKCLQEGVSKESIEICFLESKSLDPVELKKASRFKDRTKEKFYPSDGAIPGSLSPFGKLKNKLRFRPGEISVWSGINGHGKSLLIGQIMMHLAHQGEKICIASLEMLPESTLKRIIKQLSNEKLPSVEKIDQCFEWMHDKFWVFDIVGEIQVEKILEVFKYAYHRYGINQFVIDSFMRCGIDEDDHNGQKRFMNLLVGFVNQYRVHIHLVAHPRKGLNEEHFVGKMDVKGSGCITDLSWNFFSIWRNKAKEKALGGESFNGVKRKTDPRDEPDGMFICDKQREGDWENMLGLYFCPESERFYDDENYRAPNYLGDAKEEQSMMNFSMPQEHDGEVLDGWGDD